MALIPTLTLFEVEAKKFGESAEDGANDMRSASQQLKSYSDAGGQIVFGNDVGYSAHSGRIAKGMDADLVVLSADPAPRRQRLFPSCLHHSPWQNSVRQTLSHQLKLFVTTLESGGSQ